MDMDTDFRRIRAARAHKMREASKARHRIDPNSASAVYPPFSLSDTQSPYGNETNIGLTASELKVPRPPSITSANLEEVGILMRSTVMHRKLKMCSGDLGCFCLYKENSSPMDPKQLLAQRRLIGVMGII